MYEASLTASERVFPRMKVRTEGGEGGEGEREGGMRKKFATITAGGREGGREGRAYISVAPASATLIHLRKQ